MRQETTTIRPLASTLDADEHTIEAHLNGLEACELARIDSDSKVRVTITGEELLELDVGEKVIVDAATSNSGR